MSEFDKYSYIKKQLDQLPSRGTGILVGLAVGIVTASLLGSIPIIGALLALISLIGAPILGRSMFRSSEDILLRPLYMRELELHYQGHAEEASRLAEAKKEEEDKTNLQIANRLAMAKDAAACLLEDMRCSPSKIGLIFPEYKEKIMLEISAASPDQSYLSSRVAGSELANQISLRLLGVIGKDYTPASDQMYSEVIAILDRERARIKELAHITRLPYAAIEYFQEVSRNFFGLHRPGGSATIYDVQLITNEVMAMKESLAVHGDYHDNSVRIDRSVSHTTNIQSATVEHGDYSPERIKKEVLKYMITKHDESASRLELLAEIPVKESRLLIALEELQEKGHIRIHNRVSGEIVYSIDRIG